MKNSVMLDASLAHLINNATRNPSVRYRSSPIPCKRCGSVKLHSAMHYRLPGARSDATRHKNELPLYRTNGKMGDPLAVRLILSSGHPDRLVYCTRKREVREIAGGISQSLGRYSLAYLHLKQSVNLF